MRRRLAHEGGWALVTAMVLMGVMLVSSLALARYADSLTAQSGVTRARETSFNAAETALTSQVTALTSQGWPDVSAWPTCTAASVDARCPSATAMRGLHGTADTRTGFAWTTQVRDDLDGDATCAGRPYEDARLTGAPSWDSNANGCLWVRAQSLVRGRRRTLVALVRTTKGGPSLPPDYGVYSGRVDFDAAAVREFVQGAGGKVATRCTPVMDEPVACAGWRLGRVNARTLAELQASFSAAAASRDASWGVQQPTMSLDDRERWRLRAQRAGTFHTSCPSTLSGAIVWIEGPVSCSYAGNLEFNAAARPGLLVVNGGVLGLDGTTTFHGVVYFPNLSGSDRRLFDGQGNSRVRGGVIADGPALVNIGTSGRANVLYARAAYEAARLPGSAGIVQNTWRELPPNSVAP